MVSQKHWFSFRMFYNLEPNESIGDAPLRRTLLTQRNTQKYIQENI